MEIYQSASKLVFLIMAVTVCASFLMRILDAKDFMVLASMGFSFYFSSKGESTQPYGGK